MKFLLVLLTTTLVCTLVISSCSNSNSLFEENSIGAARQISKGYDLKWTANAVDESIGTEPEVREGILHFRDYKSFQVTIEKLRNSSDKEQLAYVQSKKVRSILSAYSKIDSSIARAVRAKDINTFRSILKEYSRFIIIDKDSSLVHTFADNTKAAILSEEGFVYVGKMLLYFTPYKEQIIFDGDKSKINTMSDAVQSFDFPTGGTNPTVCPNGISKIATSPFGWDRDRLEVHVTTLGAPQDNGLYSFSAFVYAKGWEETWHPFPFFFWQNVPVNNHKLNCQWQLTVFQGIPRAAITDVVSSFITESSLYIGKSGNIINVQDLATPNTASYTLILPGTGFYQGTVATVPMSCQ